MSKWTRFNYPQAKKPDVLIDFAKFIPCLNTALDTGSIESCLQHKESEEEEE